MKVIFTKLAAVLLYLWQLPQNLLGLLLVSFMPTSVPADFKGDWRRLPSALLFFSSRMNGAITFGRYVLMSEGSKYNTMAHERGHSIQSMILGPLYLIVIGIPSILWAAWWNEGRNRSYYSFYTERWADRLGGVERDE